MRIQDFLQGLRTAPPRALLSFLTPSAAQGKGLGARLLLSGGVVLVFGSALLLAVQAAALLLLALSVIYYLATQVLGVQIEFGPKEIFSPAPRPAPSSAPN